MCPRLQSTGKVRLAKWFQTLPNKAKSKIVKDVTQLVLARRTRMCNFLEYKGESDGHSTMLYPRRDACFTLCGLSVPGVAACKGG